MRGQHCRSRGGAARPGPAPTRPRAPRPETPPPAAGTRSSAPRRRPGCGSRLPAAIFPLKEASKWIKHTLNSRPTRLIFPAGLTTNSPGFARKSARSPGLPRVARLAAVALSIPDLTDAAGRRPGNLDPSPRLGPKSGPPAAGESRCSGSSASLTARAHANAGTPGPSENGARLARPRDGQS